MTRRGEVDIGAWIWDGNGTVDLRCLGSID